jgi:hypothetical protein
MNFDRGLEPSDAAYYAEQDAADAEECERERLRMEIEDEIAKNPSMASEAVWEYADKHGSDQEAKWATGVLALKQVGIGHAIDMLANMYQLEKATYIEHIVNTRLEEMHHEV